MFTLTKWTVILVIVALTLGGLSLWWQTFIVGAYYASAGTFLTILGAFAPILLLAVAFLAVRFTYNLSSIDDLNTFLE